MCKRPSSRLVCSCGSAKGKKKKEEGGGGGSLFSHCLQTRYTYVRESLGLSALLLLLLLLTAAFHTNAVNKLGAVGGIRRGSERGAD